MGVTHKILLPQNVFFGETKYCLGSITNHVQNIGGPFGKIDEPGKWNKHIGDLHFRFTTNPKRTKGTILLDLEIKEVAGPKLWFSRLYLSQPLSRFIKLTLLVRNLVARIRLLLFSTVGQLISHNKKQPASTTIPAIHHN